MDKEDSRILYLVRTVGRKTNPYLYIYIYLYISLNIFMI